MEKIRKGQKAGYTGVILTIKEADNYKKITDLLTVFRNKNKEYQQKYHGQYNKTYI